MRSMASYYRSLSRYMFDGTQYVTVAAGSNIIALAIHG
jgi:hypothetical protein